MNPVFHAPDLSADALVVEGSEGRHAAVVRLRVGEVVDLVDGHGTRVTGPVTDVTKQGFSLAVDTRTSEPAPTPRITLVQALAKGDRGELAVELATEVGVDAIVPWSAARCIAKWNDKVQARWESTAFAAAKQSRRSWFPEVHPCRTTAQVAALPGELLVLHESATTPLSSVAVTGDVVLVVGPEGGITDEEVAQLGGTAVRLGPTVLRTSTAGAGAAPGVSASAGRW